MPEIDPKKYFQTASYIQKISTLVDGGCKLDIITQELTPEEATLLFALKGKQGWFMFDESPFHQIDIPETPVEFKGDKTPSQRLRNVIHVYWTQQGSKDDFQTFYARQIEKLIDKIKELLEPENESG